MDDLNNWHCAYLKALQSGKLDTHFRDKFRSLSQDKKCHKNRGNFAIVKNIFDNYQ